MRTRASCRYCALSCGVSMAIEDGGVVRVLGDRETRFGLAPSARGSGRDRKLLLQAPVG
ncbi:MAG: hypothetical protein JRG86_04980 [Deltaproteobacteria bacterium]|nr:hypothetical protein [Deltaproteobacteria bacterium]